jgi:hypothetical protein
MDHITGREWGLLLLMDDVHHVVPAKMFFRRVIGTFSAGIGRSWYVLVREDDWISDLNFFNGPLTPLFKS